MNIKKLKTKLIIQSARHIIQKCWLTVPRHHVCTFRWPQGLKRKNLQIIRSILKEYSYFRDRI